MSRIARAYDPSGCAPGLQAEDSSPGAVLDDHYRWRETLVEPRAIAAAWMVSMALIAAGTAAMINPGRPGGAAPPCPGDPGAAVSGWRATPIIARAFSAASPCARVIGAAWHRGRRSSRSLLLPRTDAAAAFLTGLCFRGLHCCGRLVIFSPGGPGGRGARGPMPRPGRPPCAA